MYSKEIELIDIMTEDGVILNGYILKSNSKKLLISTHGMSSDCFKQRDTIIRNELASIGIDYLGYNNRGSELVKYLSRVDKNGKTFKDVGGTTYEDVLDGYYDIKACISYAIDNGYEEIYLQGHSLGSTKTLFLMSKLKKENNNGLLSHIKGVILLSLVDIPRAIKIFLKDKYSSYVEYALEKEKTNDTYDLMMSDAFIHPISVKTFLRYTVYNEEFDFACYNKIGYDFKEINDIKVPIFMRWGNDREMIETSAEDLIDLLNKKIINDRKDINYIDGANHGYYGKEKILAEEIKNFLQKI